MAVAPAAPTPGLAYVPRAGGTGPEAALRPHREAVIEDLSSGVEARSSLYQAGNGSRLVVDFHLSRNSNEESCAGRNANVRATSGTSIEAPDAFAIQVLKGFRANQGLLLAGAVAYYALLSIVPLLILTVIALSHVIDQTKLLQTLGRYLEWLVPGQSGVLIVELRNFLDHREVLGWVLLVTMLFFSSLAFAVLETAMSVILHHRVAIRGRRFLVSAVIPYCYILLLGLGLLLVTLVAGSLKAMGQEQVEFLGRDWSLGGMSGMLLYLLGVAGEIFILTSIYMVMPVGRPSLLHALIGP